MGISEIIFFMIVYGGLFIYIFQTISSNNRVLFYLKSAILLLLYIFISSIFWFRYKGEELHINNHSGYEPISYTGEAILMIGFFSIYTVILLILSYLLKRKRHSYFLSIFSK
ncbi:peptide ABC transporter permease [Ornithinibacillus massiliensis]|uniref:Peptide ABC transporter permease n=1 Tax=Ornithinibacillus massiliensis TaxID=1944633 RepID=A0ABS5MBZ5_9BACI|nr:peptide ABC transporter permease [Ornithinibacillus massiliensis]MBS3679856.1 peptide ABC transporter permease [Ornithinibacillus massiliensis]